VKPSEHRGALARALQDGGLEATEQNVATLGKLANVYCRALSSVGEAIAALRGIRIVALRELAERLERDTFSGGYNRSARERNEARLEEERNRVYFRATDGVLVCPPRVVDYIRASLALHALKQELERERLSAGGALRTGQRPERMDPQVRTRWELARQTEREETPGG
jgi:hypothetical protein